MRGMKVFASLFVLLVSFMAACGNNEQAQPVAEEAVDETVVEAKETVESAEKAAEAVRESGGGGLDPVAVAWANAGEARAQAERITGKALPVVTYNIDGDGGMGLIVVSVVVLAIIAIILAIGIIVVAVVALRRESVGEAEGEAEDEAEGEAEDEAEDMDELFDDDEEQPEPEPEPGAGEAGRGLIGLLMAVAAIGLIIALVMPAAAFTDKTAREMALANLEASKANRVAIGGLKTQLDGAVKTANEATAKILEEAKAEIAKAVEEASGQSKKNAQAIAAVKRDYILQGGPEERRLLTAVVQAAGVDLAKNPELKKLVEGFCGGKAQWAQFYELMAAAMPPPGVSQEDLDKTNATVKKVAEGVVGVAKAQEDLATQQFVVGAVSESNELLRRQMAKNLEDLKAIVRDAGSATVAPTTDPFVDPSKLEKVAKAAMLGAFGDVKASLNAFSAIYGEEWVQEVLDSIPAP